MFSSSLRWITYQFYDMIKPEGAVFKHNKVQRVPENTDSSENQEHIVKF